MTKGLRVKTLTFSGSPSSIYNLIFRLASLELPISVLPCGRFGSFCWLKEADAAPGWAGLPSKGREGTGKGNSFSSSPPRILMRRGHRGLGFLSSALKLFPFITEFAWGNGRTLRRREYNRLPFFVGFRTQSLKRKVPEASFEEFSGLPYLTLSAETSFTHQTFSPPSRWVIDAEALSPKPLNSKFLFLYKSWP